MNKSVAGQWVRAGLGLAFLLIGAVSFVSYQNVVQLLESAQQVRQTSKTMQSFTDISANLTEAEAGRWRYGLLKESQDLVRFRRAIDELQLHIDRLQASFVGTPEQQQEIKTLEQLVAERITLLQKSLSTTERSTDPASAALFAQLEENQYAIRRTVSKLRHTEEELLQSQIQQSQANLQVRMIIEVLGTVLTFVVLSGVYVLLYQQMLKRQQAEALQQQLAQQKELTEMKLQFFSMVSHEFRTPLSLIVGSAQLLAESLKSVVEPTKLKNLSRIHASAKSMVQLLNDMLTLARADAGRLEFNPNWVEMQTFCLNLIEDLEVFNQSQRSIQFIKQGNATHAWVDEKLLYSIVSNLLANAIKYSQPGSTIYFTLRCQLANIVIQIKDEGIGIPLEDQQKLYDPFSRAQNAGGISGTGLGLAIVKKCLDLHQGEIFVESQVDQGSTFTIQIPQSAAAISENRAALELEIKLSSKAI